MEKAEEKLIELPPETYRRYKMSYKNKKNKPKKEIIIPKDTKIKSKEKNRQSLIKRKVR